MSNLDVALRLRLEMWKPGQVKSAANDLARLGAAATKLNSSAVQSKLGNDLRTIGAASGKLVTPLNRAKLGADQLGKSLERVSAAGMKATINPRLQAELKGASAGMNALIAAGGKLRPVISNADGLARALDRVRAAGKRAASATASIKPAPVTPGAKPAATGPGQRVGDKERLSGKRVGQEAMLYAGGSAAVLSQGRNVVAGAAAAGGVMAVGGALAKATGEAISFEKAMAEVKKKVDLPEGAKFSQVERMISAAAVDLGRPRAEVAALTAELGAAGIAYAELPEYIKKTARAAVAWDMPLREATDKLMKIRAGNQKDGAGMDDVIDKINALSDAGASKERDVVEMHGRSVAAARASNVSENTTLAFITGMNSVGIDPEVASRGFNTMVSKLRTAKTSGGKDMEAGLKMIGMTPDQVEKGMKTDSLKTLNTLMAQFAKSTDQAAAGVKIFGEGWWDEFARMAQAAPEIAKYTAILDDPTKWKGSAQKNVNIELSTTSNHLERIKAASSDIADRLGRWTLPPIKDGLTAILDLFKQMDERADAMERAKKIAEKIAKNEPLTPQEANESAAPDMAEKVIQSVSEQREDTRNIATQDHAEIARLEAEIAALQKSVDVRRAAGAPAAQTSYSERQIAAKTQELNRIRPPQVDKRQPADAADRVQVGKEESEKRIAADKAEADGLARLYRLRDMAKGSSRRAYDDQITEKVRGEGGLSLIRKVTPGQVDQPAGDPSWTPANVPAPPIRPPDLGGIEDLKNKLTATLTQADLSPAAKEMMQKYAGALGQQGEEATKKAQSIIDQIKALLNVTLTPTIAPRLTMPSMGGATPASTGGGTPAKKSAARSSGPSPIQIGQAHFHGVNDVAGMQRQLASAANRRARDSADNSLKDMDTGAA